MSVINFLNNHKALLASISAALLAASGAVPPPYGVYLYTAAIVLAALSKGITPPNPPTPATA